MIRVDTNYILRYLINDNQEMAEIAENVLMNYKVFISNEIFAEVVYVLEGFYKISREEISKTLIEIIEWENIHTLNDNILINALKIYKSKKLDFVDCLLCAYSKYDDVLTFDKKLNKCIEAKNG